MQTVARFWTTVRPGVTMSVGCISQTGGKRQGPLVLRGRHILAAAPRIPKDDGQHQARLERIKREIELGIYETNDKLEAAVEAFLDGPDAVPATGEAANLN